MTIPSITSNRLQADLPCGCVLVTGTGSFSPRLPG